MSTMFADLYATLNDPRPQMIPKIDLNTTPNDPQIFSHATWNDPRRIIGVEWENISISGIRLKGFNSVFG